MNICKSCGVTIHEEGKTFCPACEASAKDAKEVGLTGDGPAAEQAELDLEDDTQKVTMLKLSGAGEKPASQKSSTEKIDAEFEKKQAESPKPNAAAGDDDRLAISETPMAEEFAAPASKGEPKTLADAMEKSGSDSYLSAEERKALVTELESSRKAVSGSTPKYATEAPVSGPTAKPEPKHGEAAMTVREPHAPSSHSFEPQRADRLPPTSVARGIAYYSGTHIHLVGGAHLASGEELVFKDRIYVLKEKPGSDPGNRWLYVFPLVILIMAAAILWVLSRPVPGGVAGLVLDSRNQSTMPGAKVRLLEKGLSAVTNEAGFFVLPKVPAGSYSLLAEGPGVEGKAIVQVSEGGIASVLVTAQPTPEEILSRAPALEPKTTANVQAGGESKTSEPQLASLNLAIDPPDAEAFLDGQPMGSGGIFKDLAGGRHSLVVRRDGYQEWQNQVELRPGRPNRVRVALVPKTVSPAATQPARKGFEDYLSEGQAAFAKNDFSKAISSLGEAVKIRPGSAVARSLLGEAYWGNNDVHSGTSQFLKAAELYAGQGTYRDAEKLYLKIVESDPKQAQALLELGDLYVNWGNSASARSTYQQYNKLFGTSPDGFFALGKLEYQERRFKEAAKAFEKALANSSKPGLIYGYLTLTYIQNDNKRKAQSAYDNFMKLATPDELSLLKSHRDWSRVVADLSIPE